MHTENLKQVESANPAPASGRAAPPSPPAAARRSGGKGKLVLILVLMIAAGIGFYYFRPKPGAGSVNLGETVPTVAVAKVLRQSVYNEVPIPAEFRAYVQTELHALVTGYVDQMNVDFGDKVKAGEILATIDVPELADELHNAEAREKQAEADYNNAHLIYDRLLAVNQQHPHLVAQQDIDTAESKNAETDATIAADKAEIEKYQTLVGYTKILAPFDGVITQRAVDPGALVQAGTSSDKSAPILRVSDNYHLRLDFPVSVDYVKDVKVGDPVTVRVDSLDGKTFTGKISRFTDQVNDETRTMMTELEVENPTLDIVPGMYAVALFQFDQHAGVLTVPPQAINNPKAPFVYVVNAENEVENRPVKLGVEMPDKYEILSGVKEGDLVIIGGGSQVREGQKVEPKAVQPLIIP
ncbi:MAG TPA: efflux RND transporter periplasmic adaptor subunit [Chthoniobacteraceae bacterium]|jgi:RND family efflux transporter MFP subunit|nr:efflux RND transporter periplasmic adaptor subunit [Chthoniobacteraceae bacterium]